MSYYKYIKLGKVENKHDRLFKIYIYKLFFVTDGNKNFEFISMVTISYNNIKLRALNVEIPDLERHGFFKEAKMIFEKKEEIKRKLKQYIETKRTYSDSYNVYLNANNLYRHAICQFLPNRNF